MFRRGRIGVSDDYNEAGEYVYVPARGFEGADRKMPTSAWVNDCPDDVDPRTLDNPHTRSFEETNPTKPYIIVGARGGYMLDIDVDVGDDHDVTFRGDVGGIQTPDGMLGFVSESGGPHRIAKFERDHGSLSGVDGVDLQGDMDGNHGVVTSPFHHPEYDITDEPTERLFFDNVLESDEADLNAGFGVELLETSPDGEGGDDETFGPGTEYRGREDDDGREYEEYLTDENIADALSHIPKRLHYNDWRALAFAVHDYDASENGKQLFADWSKEGSKWDDDSPDQLTGFWDHADSNSGRARKVTLGTLIKKAEDEGWEKPIPKPSDWLQNVWDTHAETIADPDGPGELGEAVEEVIDVLVSAYAAGLERATADMWLKQLSEQSNSAYTKSGLEDLFERRIDAAVSKESAAGETGEVTPRVTAFLEERLQKVVVNRVTDHNVDTSYQWHFNDGLDVVFSTTGGTHWDWYQFRERYFDETGVDLREPKDGDANDWRSFVVTLINERGEESHVRGPRTETIGGLKNYIERRTAFADLDVAAYREGVYQDGEDAAELWVLSKDIQRLCAEREVTTRGLQEELRARGLTTGSRVAERRRSNGTRVTWWRLSATIAEPRAFESGDDVETDEGDDGRGRD